MDRMSYRAASLALIWALGALCSPTHADEASDQFAVGAGHYAQGRWQLACDEFELFLEKFPEHPQRLRCLFFLGEAEVQLGQYAAARPRFEALLKEAPDHKHARRALFRAGEAALFTGRTAEARQRLKEFHERHHDDPLDEFVLPYLAQLALDDPEASDPAKAQALYVEALRRFPDGPLANESRYHLGRSLEVQQDRAAAARFYAYLAEKASGEIQTLGMLSLGRVRCELHDAREAIRWLEQAEPKLRERPEHAEAVYWLAMAHLREQDWSSAEQWFAKLDLEKTPASLTPAALYYRGVALAELDRGSEADASWVRLAADWPESAWTDDALLQRANRAAASDDLTALSEVAAQFRTLAPQSPYRDGVERMVAPALVRAKRYADAVTTLRSMLQREESPRLDDRLLLAVALSGAAEHGAALEQITTLLEEDLTAEQRQQVRLAQAASLLKLERFDDAIRPLEELSGDETLPPESRADCRADLVVAQLKSSKLAAAAETLDRLAATTPDHPRRLPLTHAVAEAAFGERQFDLARRLFAELAEGENPAEFQARGRSGLAWVNINTDRRDESIAQFQQLLRESPDSPQAPEGALMLARLQEQQGQADAALGTYALAIKNYAGTKIVPDALLAKARLHDRLRQFGEAAAVLEKFLRDHPHDSRRDAALYERAWALLGLDRTETAERLFTELHAHHVGSPYWSDATFRLAEAAAAREDWPTALSLAEQAAKEGSEQVRPHALLLASRVAVAAENWRQAVAPAESLIRDYPRSSLAPAARFYLGESRYRLHEHEAAQTHFDALASATEGQSDPWLALVELRRAQLRAQASAWGEAAELAAGIAERFPQFAQQYEADYLLGRAAAAQGEFDTARESYERVVRSTRGGKSETAAMAQWMIGETYFHQREYAQAVRAYLRVEILYDYPQWRAAALLQAGKCYELLRRGEDAAKLYARLLERYPNTRWSAEARRRLTKAQDQDGRTG